MKGYDRDVCRALHSVASECGVYLFFAHLRPVNSGPGRHRYNVDERDTHAIQRTMYSPNGKPIGFEYTQKPEEMLDLEGDLDSDDERSFTEEEDVEDASDYYITAAFLVKKKSVHRYMSHISPNSPSGYSFANTNTDNMVEMVVDDTRDFMKNQDMGEHARPLILEVLRKVLGPNENSRVLTPVVVRWALKLKNMSLYQSAMMAAAKSGVEDILESAIKTACGFVEHHFGDVPGHIDWDKWMENVAPMNTLADVHVTIQNFTSVFKKDAVRDSFVKWGDSKLTDKLDAQASFEISDWPFFVKILGGKHCKRDWLKARYE
ncbi:hypothetical protein CDEST_08041 [Colletotrichum destructivum]|uniref:Uncharacterized protein n=1 Tax=Colletotrichum destructivum TaxID=34406 RepID=A0AAX4IID1_9PEZI|nr:hypothetical protein CDEST_08041 [Colletotrichum destructivum]